jgi:hypothetical protein
MWRVETQPRRGCIEIACQASVKATLTNTLVSLYWAHWLSHNAERRCLTVDLDGSIPNVPYLLLLMFHTKCSKCLGPIF